ncbi:hypothetical protein ABZX40_40555 [Streptomyces sp. NPDC004610]|uniref:hypothetical protein n=1 Tax=unclassified Streptomyces TaxID=2593676 RepID=UPI0033B84BF8
MPNPSARLLARADHPRQRVALDLLAILVDNPETGAALTWTISPDGDLHGEAAGPAPYEERAALIVRWADVLSVRLAANGETGLHGTRTYRPGGPHSARITITLAATR